MKELNEAERASFLTLIEAKGCDPKAQCPFCDEPVEAERGRKFCDEHKSWACFSSTLLVTCKRCRRKWGVLSPASCKGVVLRGAAEASWRRRNRVRQVST